MSDKLRAVFAGCGSITNAWLKACAKMDDVEIVGMMDIAEENARKQIEKYELGDIPVETDLDKLLRETKPDAVFDCATPEAHCEITLKAFEHGCHVCGEKPLADSMESARKMVEAAEKAGKIFSVTQNRRYKSEIRRVREFIGSGAIGGLTTLNADFYLAPHFGGFRDEMDHVLLLDMAIHSFDAARLISGADPVSVYCKEWNPSNSWYKHGASAVAIFEMTDGIVFTYRGSWCAEGLVTSWESDWRAVCEGGTMTWDGAEEFRAQKPGDRKANQAPREDVEIPEIDPKGKEGGHYGAIREFVDCVKSGATPETTAADNIKSLAMVFGAIESADTGEKVMIEI